MRVMASRLDLELRDAEATRALARAVARGLAPGDRVVLEGALGAGKTLFAAALVHALGVPEDEPVTSPTFALVNEYEVEPSAERAVCLILHADLYRLSEPEEVLDLGMDEALAEGAVVVAEWGARFAAELAPDITVVLVVTGDTTRRAEIRSASERGDAVVAAVAVAPEGSRVGSDEGP